MVMSWSVAGIRGGVQGRGSFEQCCEGSFPSGTDPSPRFPISPFRTQPVPRLGSRRRFHTEELIFAETIGTGHKTENTS